MGWEVSKDMSGEGWGGRPVKTCQVRGGWAGWEASKDRSGEGWGGRPVKTGQVRGGVGGVGGQ